jgi:heptosyltransferase-2
MGTDVKNSKDAGTMKIAVFLPNWIGDVVMATPAFAAVREHFSSAEIFAVGRPYVRDVLAGAPWFNDFLSSESLFGTIRSLRGQRPELAILFTNSFRSAFQAWLGGCRRRIGYARDGRSWLLTDGLTPIRDADGRFLPSPILDAYNLLAVRAGCAQPGRRTQLFTTRDDETAADTVWKRFGLGGTPTVVLNPGAAFGASKLWPVGHFAKLARLLVEQRDANILILCGPKERELARSIATQAGADRLPIHSLAEEPVSLGLLKACVRRGDLLITTDSGPRHFAQAFDRPVITLFGPTHIAWTETYFEKAVHLQVKVPCGPCQLRACPLDHRCMRELTPERVFAAACQHLDRFATPVQERKAS